MTRPRIALVELYGHHEVLEALVRTLSGEFDLELYVSAYVRARLPAAVLAKADHCDVCPPEAALPSYLRRHHERLSGCGLCVLVTLELTRGLAEEFTSLPTATALCVHDARFHFAAEVTPVPTPAAWLRRLKYRLRGTWAERLQHDRGWSGYVVRNEAMGEFLGECGIEAPLLTFGDYAPADVRAPATPPQPGGPLRLGVPGGINFATRDYRELEAAIVAEGRACTWVFPGRAKGRRERRWLARLARRAAAAGRHEVDYRDGAPGYLETLSACDALVLPLRERIVFAAQYERGGVTKVSGAENDQRAVGRPAFVRAGYRGTEGLAHAQASYASTAELLSLIEGFPARPTGVPEPTDWVALGKRWREFYAELSAGSGLQAPS